jgi:hypothetical protein
VVGVDILVSVLSALEEPCQWEMIALASSLLENGCQTIGGGDM